MMTTGCTKFERLKLATVVVTIVCLSVLNIRITQVFADPAASAIKVSQAEASDDSEIVLDADPATKNKPETKTQKTAVDTSPKKTKSSDTNPMVYVGIGLAAAAAVGLAAAAGGGSSDSDGSSSEGGGGGSTGRSVKPTTEPKNATLWGDNWSGRLLLINGQSEPVTAVIYQDGAQIEIVTSTSQRYGKRFVGSVSSSGHMRMIDQTTGELWTTFMGPANSTRIDLYDFVNNLQDLDNLLLTRSSKQLH